MGSNKQPIAARQLDCFSKLSPPPGKKSTDALVLNDFITTNALHSTPVASIRPNDISTILSLHRSVDNISILLAFTDTIIDSRTQPSLIGLPNAYFQPVQRGAQEIVRS